MLKTNSLSLPNLPFGLLISILLKRFLLSEIFPSCRCLQKIIESVLSILLIKYFELQSVTMTNSCWTSDCSEALFRTLSKAST